MSSEAAIQTAVVKYARAKGCLAKKLSVQGAMGSAGWPDYMILVPPRGPSADDTGPHVYFIEFKRPGGKLTPLQEGIKAQLRKLQFNYYTVCDTAFGKGIVDAELRP